MSLSNYKFLRVLSCAEFSLTLWCQNKRSSILLDMAKVAIKYDIWVTTVNFLKYDLT